MKGMGAPCPDGRYDLKGFAHDEERDCVLGFAVFHATHTDPGGPVEPTLLLVLFVVCCWSSMSSAAGPLPRLLKWKDMLG